MAVAKSRGSSRKRSLSGDAVVGANHTGSAESETTQQKSNSDGALPNTKRLRFRNYVPRTPTLDKYMVASKPVEESLKLLALVNEQAAELVKRFKEDHKNNVELAPTKINFDLKRNAKNKVKLYSNL